MSELLQDKILVSLASLRPWESRKKEKEVLRSFAVLDFKGHKKHYEQMQLSLTNFWFKQKLI